MLPLRDLEQVKSFVSGSGPIAFCDLPRIPLYVGLCFLFHPLIGVAVIAGAGVLFALTLVTERSILGPAREATAAGTMRLAIADGARRNAEVLHALGMSERMTTAWERSNGSL